MFFFFHTFSLSFSQIRLRRLRKLGVNNSNENNDESANQKRAVETSNNNNLASNTSTDGDSNKKDDNKNTILSTTSSSSTTTTVAVEEEAAASKKINIAMNTTNLEFINMDVDSEKSDNYNRTICNDNDMMEIDDPETIEKSFENSILKAISRVLDASWDEHSEGSHIVKDTMTAIIDGSLQSNNYPDLISDIINDVIRQYLSSSITKEVEVNSLSDQILSSRMRNDDIERDYLEEIQFGEASRTKQTTKTSTVKEAALYYLIECHNRAINEKQHKEMSEECKRQLINYAIHLLDHEWIFDSSSSTDIRSRSPLLQIMYDEVVSYHNFIQHLMSEAYENHPKRFTRIFNVVLEDIYLDMRCKQIKMFSLPTHSIDRLIELISLELIGNRNVRPICNLVTAHRTFMPALCTDIPGREISHLSYLSPFLSISVLVYDRFYDADNNIDPSIQLELQSKLEYVRTLLHRLFYAFVSNKDTRDVSLKYIAELLKQNSKREQFNADERSLAQDGFMLNLMAVLQHLSVKIKLQLIDPLYPFHPQSLINIDDDTKLRFETSEFVKHMEKLKDSVQWTEPKFVSHCWFFTLHSHHLGIIPAISRYHKRLRAIKELQRMVDELNATESRWENTHLARRNRNARDKWVTRIKKLTKAKNTMEVMILDPNLNRDCLQFYSTVCEFILHHIEARNEIEFPFYNKILASNLVASNEFSCLPTWYIEDIADYLLFLLQ